MIGVFSSLFCEGFRFVDNLRVSENLWNGRACVFLGAISEVLCLSSWMVGQDGDIGRFG